MRTLFFAHVSKDELQKVCSLKTEVAYGKGDVIVKEGDKIGGFLYLQKGLLKLSRKTSDGRDQILCISKPFDFVSLLSVFSASEFNYSVTAISDSLTCVLDFNMVKDLVKENGSFALDLIQKLSETSDQIILNSLEIKRKHLHGRVAHVLLFFSDDIYKSAVFELPLSRKEIAEYIGMTTENVIRTLSEFRKDGIIGIEGKRITIIDSDRLHSISEHG
jgi:CRP/FNR family transcriptional regulator